MSARTAGEIERDAQLLATLRRIADALDAIHGTIAAMWAEAEKPVQPVITPLPLAYAGNGKIVKAKTGDLVSPRAVVENYNAMVAALGGPAA